MTTAELQGKTVCVLDTHGILYQVFHTMRDMSSPQGEPTGAVFGFVRDLITLFFTHRPDYMFCAFDRPGPTFRHNLYTNYKANREAMPDDLRPQIGYTKEFVNAFGIASIGLEGYEADDLLATVARLTEEKGGKCLLVTADKDARQLITDQVSLFNLRKQFLYNKKELFDDWGIRPDQVIDFQTMVGDSTDNIPGIPLIGPKTATQLLSEYGTLENIIAHLEDLKGKKKENIAQSVSQLPLIRQLVQLKNDVPVNIDWNEAEFHGVDPLRLKNLFLHFGFRAFIPKVEELVQNFGSIEYTGSVDGSHVLEQVGLSLPDTSEKGNTSGSMTVSSNGGDNLLKPSLLDDIVTVSAAHDIIQCLEDNYLNLFTAQGFTGKIPDQVDYRLVDTEEKWQEFLALLKQQTVFSIDLETTNIHPRFARIVGIAICFELDRAWYIPVRGPLGSDLLNESDVLEQLRPILESNSIHKIGQNIKYDMIVFRSSGISLKGVVFDTMVADYLLNTGARTHNLDDMSDQYLGHTTIKISELIGTGKNQKQMNDVQTSAVAQYAGEDALTTWALFAILFEKLKKEPFLLQLLIRLEMPLIDVLVELEYTGIAVDTEYFRKMSQTYEHRLAELDSKIRETVASLDSDESFARNFNINSSQQLQRVLFDDLHLPSSKKTKTGRSTDVDVLEELAYVHPLPEMIIGHRQLSKLKGTYLDPIPQLRHPETGRIHTSFNQVVTATGRLSSSDPNLQNIPIRTDEGKQIRQGFIPDAIHGFDTLLSCDYSQIELRVLTHFSEDANLRQAFEKDEDIHTHVAANIFDIPLSMVTSEMRRKAKAVNFGLIYGQSAFGLSKALHIPREEAAEYIKSFFDTYPGIPIFLDRVLNDCLRKGYVTTILGRKRRIEGVREFRKGGQLNMPERTAINTVIQGSAADIMKLAMVKVYRHLYEVEKIAPEKVGMLLQIHDELVFETSRDFVKNLAKMVEEEMLLGQPLSVPLKVDIETGNAWGTLSLYNNNEG